MFLDTDDARTDVILAAVTAVLGVRLRAFVQGQGGYPSPGTLTDAVLELVWIVALTALVPVLLARYRGDGLAAFGFRGTPRAWITGVALAVPAIVVGVVGQLLAGLDPLLGRSAIPVTGVLGLDVALGLTRVAAFSVGAVVLYGFLGNRAAAAFPRSPDVAGRQLLRTAGLALVAVAAVGGLLRAIGPGTLTGAALTTIGLLALLLVADRVLDLPRALPRAVAITPLVVVLVGQILGSGGIFFGDLLGALTFTAISGGAALAIALSGADRRGTGLVVPLAVAVHWWPTCLSPLLLAPGLC
jgi:hypothetical protein